MIPPTYWWLFTTTIGSKKLDFDRRNIGVQSEKTTSRNFGDLIRSDHGEFPKIVLHLGPQHVVQNDATAGVALL